MKNKCGFFGCQLQNLHAGMHICPTINMKTRRTMKNPKRREITNSDTNKYIKNMATISNSPTRTRKDVLIDHKQIKFELIYSRLIQMKKEIDDLIEAL